MTTLVRDLRYAVRGLKKNPGATAVIVLALALGIGVNASCFITVSAVILHPLPYPNLDRIMTVWESPANIPADRGPAAPANYFDWKEQSRSFQHLAAYRLWDANLSGIDDPERVLACQVTAEYFSVLGLKPALGRAFRAEDTSGAGTNVLVVSDGFWKRRLAAASAVLGKTITLNGSVYTVVGVMPEEFNFPLETEVWAPLTLSAAQRHDRESHNLGILGRLKPGIPVEQARAEMNAIGQRIAAENRGTNENREVQVIPVRELTNNVTDRFTLTLLVTAGFVLLLASANVANLLLVRLASRQKEIAIRTAMGATRFQIVRALVAESVLIALASGVLGLWLADWNLSLAHYLIPAQVLRWVAGVRNMHIDAIVMVFTLAVSLIAALLCVTPAIIHVLRSATASDLNDALKEGGRGGTVGRGQTRLRTTLAVAEVALALILLIGAGVMVRAFQKLLTVSPGFNTQNLLTMQIALPASRYAANTQVSGFYTRLLRGLENVPGAQAAAVGAGLGAAPALYIEGRPDPRPGEPVPFIHAVSGEYFRTLGLPVLQGRGISSQDDQEYQPVIVISESVARNYWRDANPVGHRIRLSKTGAPWLTVVGVSGDVKDWFTNRPIYRAYVSFLQSPSPDASVFIRTAGDPLQATAGTRAELRKVDRSQPVFDVKSMEQSINEQTSGVRAAAVYMVTYAGIALILAAMGIYAVISYSVAQRTHEIGIRMALGANHSDILSMTLSDAIRIGAIGLAIGVPVSLILIRVMSSVLYGVISMSIVIFAGATLVLAASAVLAGYLPAVRGARVDPITALRNE